MGMVQAMVPDRRRVHWKPPTDTGGLLAIRVVPLGRLHCRVRRVRRLHHARVVLLVTRAQEKLALPGGSGLHRGAFLTQVGALGSSRAVADRAVRIGLGVVLGRRCSSSGVESTKSRGAPEELGRKVEDDNDDDEGRAFDDEAAAPEVVPATWRPLQAVAGCAEPPMVAGASFSPRTAMGEARHLCHHHHHHPETVHRRGRVNCRTQQQQPTSVARCRRRVPASNMGLEEA